MRESSNTTLKKITLTVFCASVLLTTTSRASQPISCFADRQQMYDQISQYRSISTRGCPLHKVGSRLGNGVVRVSAPMSYSTICYAACSYPGEGKAVPCQWQLGNWGDTLSCS